MCFFNIYYGLTGSISSFSTWPSKMSFNVLKMSPLFLEQIKNIKDFSSLYSVKMIFKKYDSA